MIVIQVTDRGATPENLGKREFNKLLAKAWLPVGVQWHQDFVPKHFTDAGAREYRYKKRQGDQRVGVTGIAIGKGASTYTLAKQRKKGHTTPMVWSGESRDAAKFAKITSTSKGVTIRIAAPNIGKRTKSGRIRKSAELARTSAPERRELEKTVDAGLGRELDQFSKTKTEKIAA